MILGKMIGIVFEKVTNKMIDAFEKRALEQEALEQRAKNIIQQFRH